MLKTTIKMADKKLRISRLFNSQSEKTFIVPIDHGITIGPVDSLANYPSLVNGLVNNGVDAIILHKGLIKQIAKNPELSKGKYILHLSASTILSKDSSQKVLVSTVEEAIMLGADGVSIHVNLGVKSESDMLKDFGEVSNKCFQWGIPLVAMIYVHNSVDLIENLCHAARIAEELGADIVKLEYPGTIEGMKKILMGVQIPVIIAGGSKKDNPERLLCMVNEAMLAGSSGVAIGRNIFEYKDPALLSRLVSKLIHGELNLEGCLMKLSEASLLENYWKEIGVR